MENAIPKVNNHLEKCSRYAGYENFTLVNNCSDFNTDIVEQCDSFVYEGIEKTILTEVSVEYEQAW